MYHAQLRAFHAVAEAGGFTAAAARLGVGQPTLSIQVRALEAQFGVELIHRRGRRIQLSELGQSLFKVTQRCFGAETEAVELLRAVRALDAGHLRLGTVGPYNATELLARFSKRFPRVRVTVTLGNSQEMLQQLLDLTADVAVLAQTEPDARFHARAIGRYPVVVMVPRGHRFWSRRGLRAAELAQERMVMREEGSTTRRAYAAALASAGLGVEIAMELGSREAVWHAVARGIGIGIVSAHEVIPHTDIRILPIADLEITTEEQIVCLAERRESRLVAAFLAVAEETTAHP
jgi:aminoethylphosphonate catabolism LysR family transcriptional regulator